MVDAIIRKQGRAYGSMFESVDEGDDGEDNDETKMKPGKTQRKT